MEKQSYNFSNAEELRDTLVAAGLPVERWGIGPTKTYEDLYDELVIGESEMVSPESETELDEYGEIIRTTNVLGVDVFAIVDGKLFLLREDKQVFKDGRGERKRSLETSIGEKIKKDEDRDAAVLRAVQEELGISDVESVADDGCVELWKRTPTYPGLPSKLMIYRYVVMINPQSFKPEGYIEDQSSKQTFFVWNQVSPSS